MPKHFRTVSLTLRHRDEANRPPVHAVAPDTTVLEGALADEPGVAASDLLLVAKMAGSDEATARHYLNMMFAAEEDEVVSALTAPASPEVVPEMRATSVRSTPGARATSEAPVPPATLVSFVQVSSGIPIFGSHAKVTLTADRNILAAIAQVAAAPDVSPIASLSVHAALIHVGDAAGKPTSELGDVTAPRLEFFQDEESGAWHLVYHFAKVPATPLVEKINHDKHGHGFSTSPREVDMQFDYLIDAHNGTVVYYYSSNPFMAPPPPVKCNGDDEFGAKQDFLGSPDASGFVMLDPLRRVRTFDLGFADIASPLPPTAITSPVSKPWPNSGAVSAHVNATRVQRFFYNVLGRNSIDDLGMEIVSVVNCTYTKSGEAAPNWTNAVWHNNRMWYGQTPNAAGRLVSFSRLLDIIAHELTHGVTAHTAGLVYRDLPGALNESFSDIFGVIINNWFSQGAASDVSTWSWEIGAGLRAGGLPFRDMQDPARLGHPVKMSQYVKITTDAGGVHTYSNIHNVAAYHTLTAGTIGARPVSPADAAVIYYKALQNLSAMSNFSDARRAVTDAATIYYGDPAERTAALAAIAAAYDKAEIV